MTREFELRKNATYSARTEPIDVEAMRFTQSWHRYPGFHEAMWYRGVNLGEADEFILMTDVVPALLEREKRSGH